MKITDIKTLIVNAQLRARKHPFEQEVLEQMHFHPEGSVAEW